MELVLNVATDNIWRGMSWGHSIITNWVNDINQEMDKPVSTQFKEPHCLLRNLANLSFSSI